MKIVNTVILTIITAALLAHPAHAMSMQRIKDLLSSVTARFAQTEYNKPSYLIGAACAAGIATAGLAWYAYNAIAIAKRTYLLGNEKFIAPEGAQISTSTSSDKTIYKHKHVHSFSLKQFQIKSLSTVDGRKKSNSLQVYHESYNNDPRVTIFLHSNVQNMPEPRLVFDRKNKKLAVEIPNSQSIGRVDYVFMFGTEQE